jgi:hypothetical protein
MSARATKSITWLWIASLLIATVGVSGQQIYCYCMGKTTFSLFVAPDGCAEKPLPETQKCCAVNHSKIPKSCCEKERQVKTAHGCTQKTTKVFQLKTEFTVQEKLTEQLPDFSIEMETPVVPLPVCICVVPDHFVGIQSYPLPPPPLSGRMLCVRYGVFRC